MLLNELLHASYFMFYLAKRYLLGKSLPKQTLINIHHTQEYFSRRCQQKVLHFWQQQSCIDFSFTCHLYSRSDFLDYKIFYERLDVARPENIARRSLEASTLVRNITTVKPDHTNRMTAIEVYPRFNLLPQKQVCRIMNALLKYWIQRSRHKQPQKLSTLNNL